MPEFRMRHTSARSNDSVLPSEPDKDGQMDSIKPQKQSVAYWGPINPSLKDKATGMGIFHENVVSLMSTIPEFDFRVVPLKSALRPEKFRLISAFFLLRKLSKDFWLLMRESADILLFSYPGIPFAPLTSNAKLPIAFFAYFCLLAKKKWTGQAVTVMIADLPMEQAESFGLKVHVGRGAYNTFERYLFKHADYLITFSNMFIERICEKHALNRNKMVLCRRWLHMPRNESQSNVMVLRKGVVKIFYSGELRRKGDRANIEAVINRIKKHLEATLYVCGLGGEWISESAIPNVVYLGMLSYSEYDFVAGQCDFALILYPPDPYYHLTPTAKYPTYVANGLPVLSTDIKTVAQYIEEDGVGKALPFNELLVELERWIVNPEALQPYRVRAAAKAKELRTGQYLKECFNQITKAGNAGDGGSRNHRA